MMGGLEWLLGGAGAVVLAILGAWLKGRGDGRRQEQRRQRDAQLEAHRQRNRTDEDIARLDGGAVRDGLRDWTD